MATIIGRQNEMSELRKYIDSDKAEFIAIYGRRRVGKTFLVREMFKDKFVFEVSGTIGGKKNEQMFNFLQALHRYGYDGTETPTTWNAAFNLLQQLLEKKAETQKCILFMDELPCFDTPKAGFVRAFDHFWNGWASHYPNIKLIVCGSATSWMVENIIDNHGGLHNRITHEIHLRPFTLVEAEDYFNQYGFEWNRLSVLQAYMALGGVPYYYSLLDNHLSLAQNIDRLFFHEDGEMRREHDRLFKSLFASPDAYLSIIKVLAESKKGLSRDEIAGKAKLSNNGYLTKLLSNLVNCDFIRSFHVKEKKIKNNAQFYQLTDLFTLFHYTFAQKQITDENYWSNMLGTNRMNTWLGLAFERVCLLHIPQIKRTLGIDRIHTEYYSWRSKQSQPAAQIDLIIERADQLVNICEVKYSEYEYAIDKAEDNRLRIRMGNFKEETQTKGGLHLTLITTFGIKKNMYSDSVRNEVTMDDLFQ